MNYYGGPKTCGNIAIKHIVLFVALNYDVRVWILYIIRMHVLYLFSFFVLLS